MKYIINIPEKVKWIQGIKSTGFGTQDCGLVAVEDLKLYTELDRKAVENEVWEFMNKLIFMKYDDIRDCFGSDSSFIQILKKCSYQEAKEKYEAWKKQKHEIYVGDEVFHKDYPNDKVVVTRLYQSGYLCADILFPNGGTDQEILVNNLVKTGRHFPEVEELLKKMEENT